MKIHSGFIHVIKFNTMSILLIVLIFSKTGLGMLVQMRVRLGKLRRAVGRNHFIAYTLSRHVSLEQARISLLSER